MYINYPLLFLNLNYKNCFFFQFLQKMKPLTSIMLIVVFCCVVSTMTTNGEMCRGKCQTTFDLCIHSSTSVMVLDLVRFKMCSDNRRDCRAGCRYRKKRELLILVPVKSEIKTKRNESECIIKCQQKQFNNCNQKTFDEMYSCLRKLRGECHRKCTVKVRLRLTKRKRKFGESSSSN